MTQTVLITGANRGLGLSLAAKFLREGFLVFATTRTPQASLHLLTDQFAKTLSVVAMDVADTDSVRKAAETVAAQTPTLDILINNAAIYPEGAKASLDELDLSSAPITLVVMDVNVFGPLRVTQQFLPLLEKGQRKLLINVSSEAGSLSDCWRDKEFPYCMSKAALNLQSKILQNYLWPKKIKVLAVHPGWMRTDMGGADADIHPDEAADGIFELTTRVWESDEPIYVNYDGSLMEW